MRGLPAGNWPSNDATVDSRNRLRRPSAFCAHMVMWVKRPPPETSFAALAVVRHGSLPAGPPELLLAVANRDAGATYASIPMIGLTPSKPLATCWNSYAPNMLPWSLIAIAGMPCRATSANIGFSFCAPSSIEYSV